MTVRVHIRHGLSSVEKMRIERVHIIKSLVADGFNQSEVADKMGISRQRISQLLTHDRDRARRKARYAIKHGHLEKPLLCDVCDLEKPLQAHHSDYNEPLAVIWVCEPCHAELDNRGWKDGEIRNHRKQPAKKPSKESKSNG